MALREIALRDGGAVCRLRRVEALARQRAALEQVLRALVLAHRVGQCRLGAFDRRLGDADGGDRRIDLRVDLAAIDRGDHLPGGDAIADVDEHALEPAGQLRLDADARPRRQRARDFERRFDRADRRADDGNVDDRRGRRRRGASAAAVALSPPHAALSDASAARAEETSDEQIYDVMRAHSIRG